MPVKLNLQPQQSGNRRHRLRQREPAQRRHRVLVLGARPEQLTAYAAPVEFGRLGQDARRCLAFYGVRRQRVPVAAVADAAPRAPRRHRAALAQDVEQFIELLIRCRSANDVAGTGRALPRLCDDDEPPLERRLS